MIHTRVYGTLNLVMTVTRTETITPTLVRLQVTGSTWAKKEEIPRTKYHDNLKYFWDYVKCKICRLQINQIVRLVRTSHYKMELDI